MPVAATTTAGTPPDNLSEARPRRANGSASVGKLNAVSLWVGWGRLPPEAPRPEDHRPRHVGPQGTRSPRKNDSEPMLEGIGIRISGADATDH